MLVVVLLVWVVVELFSQMTVVVVVDPEPPPVTTTVFVHPVPDGVGVTDGVTVGVGVTEGEGDTEGVGVPKTRAVEKELFVALADVVNFAKELLTRMRQRAASKESPIVPRFLFIILIHEMDLWL